MTLLGPDEFTKYDAALDGVGLLIDPSIDTLYRSPYSMEAQDLLVDKQDQSADLDQNRLDTLYWGSNRSWHNGSGQQRLSMPSASDPYKFFSSKGISIVDKGKASLLKRTALALALTNQDPVVQKMAVTDGYVFVAAGQPNLKRFAALDGSDAVSLSTATETAQEVQDLASDGSIVYAALGPDGTHQVGIPVPTTQEAFDTGVWTDTAATSSYDTANKKEGASSRKVAPTGTGAASSKLTWGAPKDLSAAGITNIRLWVYASRALAAGEAKIQLMTSVGNYYQRSLPAIPAGAWYQDVSNKATDWVATGAPNWNSIASVILIVPSVAAPAFRSSTFRKDRLTATANPNVPAASLPAGTVKDDVLLWSVQIRGGTTPGTVTTPTGWTLLDTGLYWSNTVRHYTFYKAASANEPGSYAAPGFAGGSGVQDVAQTILSYSGCNPASPIDGHAAQSNASSTSVQAPSITPATTNTKLVNIYMVGSNPLTITPPGGQTKRAAETSTVNPETMAADETLAASGATGTRTATLSSAFPNAALSVALKAAVPYVEFDNLETLSVAAFAHYSDWDARTLGWCKGALYGAGIKSGTTWRFFAVGSGATSTEIFPLPAGWVVTDIVDLADHIYFAAYRGRQGAIYAYDGINPPFIAVPPDALAAGDLPLALGPFYGAGMLIGCRRPSATGSGGQGVLYRAFPSSTGQLSVEELQVIGADDGKDYGVRCARQIGKYAYYGYSFGDAASSGLGIYVPETGAFTRNIDASVSGPIVDVVSFKGRKFFAVDGAGIYVEQATYVDSGWIISSVIDANVSADKTWLLQELDYDLKGSDASLTMEYSIDGGTTWSGLHTSASGTARLRSGLDAKAWSVQYRVTLLPSSALSVSPDLTFAGIGGWPAQKPTMMHKMELRVGAVVQNKVGEQTEDKNQGWNLLNALVSRWAAGEVYDYQPPWWPASQTALKVRIAGVTPWNGWGLGGDKQDGNITLILKEVEAILS